MRYLVKYLSCLALLCSVLPLGAQQKVPFTETGAPVAPTGLTVPPAACVLSVTACWIRILLPACRRRG